MHGKRAMWAALATAAAAAGGHAESDASSRTIMVPQDYKSVQAAVDASSPGDTIIVQGGTYAESLVVSGGRHDGLQIYANNGATLRGASGVPGIKITSSSVGVHGFVLSGGAGVVVSQAWDVTVDGTTVEDAKGDAFRVENSSYVSLETNRVDVASGAGFRVTNSTGVEVQANDVSGVADGVVISGGTGVSACSNSFDGVDGAGVTASDTSDLVVDESSMTDVGRTGIEATNVGSVYVGSNVIDDHHGVSPVTGDGIRIEQASDVELEDNTVVGALGHGIEVISSGLSQVDGSQVSNTGGDGIHVDAGADQAEVGFNTVDGSSGDGIAVLSVGSNVHDNTIDSVGGDGVAMTGGAGTVAHNDVKNPGHDGVALVNGPDDAAAKLDTNRVTGAGHDGIALGDTCGATVTGNVVTHAAVNGVEITTGDQNVLSKNRASKSGGFDLFEGDATNPNLVDGTNKFKRAHRRGGSTHHHHHHG